MKERTEIKSFIIEVIENLKVHIIFLIQDFASCTWCWHERKVIPVFYDVKHFVVLHKRKASVADLSEVNGSADKERECWSKALTNVSHFKGFEYGAKFMIQWEKLQEIVTKVFEYGAKFMIQWEKLQEIVTKVEAFKEPLISPRLYIFHMGHILQMKAPYIPISTSKSLSMDQQLIMCSYG
ncbi:hypothetical protein KP509_04G017400 [Ceratopteris richardii]|uniref:Uncharacterized protein n=1 Tax=Ceratopteris richardii TaxID=49495 RepID=A0A8T2UX71_CERRI|nr:hypothetical protein KP509_04G017400 [Ceratopteris richardii]